MKRIQEEAGSIVSVLNVQSYLVISPALGLPPDSSVTLVEASNDTSSAIPITPYIRF